MTDLPVSTETLGDLEKQIAEIIKRDNMTPAKVSLTIGDHGKTLIRMATAHSREAFSKLFAAAQDMDSHLADEERKLCAKIDQQVAMANNARQAAEMLCDTLKSWQESVPAKSNGAG
jgi:phosphopentomutase